jgi:hypothetical protein
VSAGTHAVPFPLRPVPVFLVEASALVPHAPAAVFSAAASLEGAVRWQSGVVGVRRPRGPAVRTGPLVLLYRALGERHLLDASVTAFEPPLRFAYRAAGAAFAIETALTVEQAVGGARVRYEVALHTTDRGVPPPVSTVDPSALRRLVARRTAGDLARLAAWVAARQEVRGATGLGLPPSAAV